MISVKEDRSNREIELLTFAILIHLTGSPEKAKKLRAAAAKHLYQPNILFKCL